MKLVQGFRPLPSPVLRTDYRLRSIAAGDRARCSFQGEGIERVLWSRLRGSMAPVGGVRCGLVAMG